MITRLGRTMMLFALPIVALLVGCWAPIAPPPARGGGSIPFDTLNFVWHVKKPWDVGQNSESDMKPAIVNDSIIICGFGEGFVCLNINTGATIWKNQIGINPSAYPKPWDALDILIENGRVYTLAGSIAIRGSKASVVCLSAMTGQLMWRHDLVEDDNASDGYFSFYWSHYATSPTAIFYSTQSGHVVALSKADGSVLWDSPNGSTATPLYESEPCYRNGVVYVGSCPESAAIAPGLWRDGAVVALDANTGNVLWSKILPSPDSSIIGYANWKLLNSNAIQAAPVPTDKGIIIEPGLCVALMDTTGKLVWRSAPNVNGGISPYIWQPFLWNGQLYGYNSGNVGFFAYDIDASTGAIRWVRTTQLPNNTATINPPQIDSNGLYEVTDDEEWSLWGQSLADGSTFLYTPLFWYENFPDDAFDNQYLISGKRVYYQTQDEIICIERK